MTSGIDVASSLTNIQNNTTQINAQKNAKTAGTDSMGQDAFLQLLMAQMQNQDPLNPTDSNTMMAQEASFSQLNELQTLNKTVSSGNEMMQASSLIGKDVSLTDPNNANNTISGTVSAATLDSTGANVIVNGSPYPMSSIVGIQNASTSTNTGTSGG